MQYVWWTQCWTQRVDMGCYRPVSIRAVTSRRPAEILAIRYDVGSGGMAVRAFTNRIHIGLDVVAPLYATKTEFGEQFRQIVAAEGVPAAVRWRAAQFN